MRLPIISSCCFGGRPTVKKDGLSITPSFSSSKQSGYSPPTTSGPEFENKLAAPAMAKKSLLSAQTANNCPPLDYDDFLPAELAGALRSRLSGQSDCVDVFWKYLNTSKFFRFALVNLAALYCDVIAYDADRASYIRPRLEKHVVENSSDQFARLVLSFLQNRCGDELLGLETLERLYLDFPGYVPAVSSLAAYLRRLGYEASSSDFAEEALSKNPEDAQAKAVLDTVKRRPIELDDDRHFCRKSGIVPHLLYSALYLPYEIVDPGFFYEG